MMKIVYSIASLFAVVGFIYYLATDTNNRYYDANMKYPVGTKVRMLGEQEPCTVTARGINSVELQCTRCDSWAMCNGEYKTVCNHRYLTTVSYLTLVDRYIKE